MCVYSVSWVRDRDIIQEAVKAQNMLLVWNTTVLETNVKLCQCVTSGKSAV